MRFSIFTPTKDRAEWLPRCIESVRAQTFEDWEHTIYDNGESSVEHLIPDDERIRYVAGAATGNADAYNRAFALTSGAILHPLADDDRLAPDALEIVDRAIGEAEWLHGLTAIVDVEDNDIDTVGGPLDVEALKMSYNLGGAIFWKRQLTARTGIYDVAYDGAADYKLYMEFVYAAPEPVYVDRVLYIYMDHPGSHSRQNPELVGNAINRVHTGG